MLPSRELHVEALLTYRAPSVSITLRLRLARSYTIAYKTAGCGSPVLLVHGFGLSSFHYRRNIPEIAQNHKVYAIDLLGFGDSSKVTPFMACLGKAGSHAVATLHACCCTAYGQRSQRPWQPSWAQRTHVSLLLGSLGFIAAYMLVGHVH
jgi:pimeloyl-ACP methyl ester carboxylesterase